MFIAPKFWMESSFLTIVFFLDIRTAPFDKLEERITGRRSGVIPIAIATAKVKAVIISCFQAFSKKTIGIIINMKRINSRLILSIPFWKAVLGFPTVKVWATFPK